LGWPWQEARVKQHYRQGMELMTERKWEEAQQHFTNTLNDIAFERDIIGNARFSALRKVRGLCFKMLSQIAEEQGDKDTAMRRLGDALALDDSDVIMWHRLGCLALDVNRLNVARTAFERGLKLRPHHPLFLDKLCEVAFAIGDFDACRSAADMLLTLAPAHPRGLVYKGLVMCRHISTEVDGNELLEDAQDADGALSRQEVERLRNLDRKRPRCEALPVPPRDVVLTDSNWRCLLENVLQMLSSTAGQSAVPEPVDDPPTTQLNQVCVLKLAESPAEQLAKACPANGANDRVHLEDIADDRSLACDVEEKLHDEEAALCMVCSGDVDPGLFPGDELLLCENYEKCGQAYHTTCLTPPLKDPPGADEPWFCPKCDPKYHASSQTERLMLQLNAAPRTPGGRLPPTESPTVAAETGGEGGEELSPSKRAVAKRSRTSNLSVSSVPSRSSRRTSQVQGDKRPPEAAHIGRILELVAVAGPDETGEEEETASPRPLTPSMQLMVKDGEVRGNTLSRFEMIQRLGAGSMRAHESAAAKLLADLSLKPLCLLEIVHKIVHTLSSMACEARLRGRVVDLAMQIDAAARGRLSYSPQASLFFAELHLDR
jgi:tetratricopeptide (TPR) repeat protein